MDMTAQHNGQATLHYGDGEFAVLKPGSHVICGISGQPVPLERLRYWSVEDQMPFYGPVEALTHATASG